MTSKVISSQRIPHLEVGPEAGHVAPLGRPWRRPAPRPCPSSSASTGRSTVRPQHDEPDHRQQAHQRRRCRRAPAGWLRWSPAARRRARGRARGRGGRAPSPECACCETAGRDHAPPSTSPPSTSPSPSPASRRPHAAVVPRATTWRGHAQGRRHAGDRGRPRRRAVPARASSPAPTPTTRRSARRRPTPSGTTGRRWIIDPIDGTKAFTHGVPLYSQPARPRGRARPAVGVINLPALGETVYAGRGLGLLSATASPRG